MKPTQALSPAQPRLRPMGKFYRLLLNCLLPFLPAPFRDEPARAASHCILGEATQPAPPKPPDLFKDRPSCGASAIRPAGLAFLKSCKASQFVWPGHRPAASYRPTQPGYLCVYAGKRGVAKAVAKGGVWALTFDWLSGPEEDLLKPELQDALVSAAEANTFLAVGFAPICSSFSTAITPPIRNNEFPEGLLNLSASFRQKVFQGNQHASFVARFVLVLSGLGIPTWIENPDRSWLWKQPCFAPLLLLSGVGFWRCDCCVFSKPWRKRTRILTSKAASGFVRGFKTAQAELDQGY